jgi:hypothetical protein
MGTSFPRENQKLLVEPLFCGQGAGRSVMPTPEIIAEVRNKYQALRPVMDEKVRRRWAACEAMAIGWGGITAVAAATGLSRPTLRAGIAEVRGGVPHAEKGPPTEAQRIRRDGGGQRRLTAGDRTLLQDLQAVLESSTRGDPQTPLLWTSKSTRHLADALVQQGHHVRHYTSARWLDDLPSSLQAHRKTQEGRSHPDRDAPCAQITPPVRAFQKRWQPVVAVDTQQTEGTEDCQHAGREWHPQGQPVKGRSQDVLDTQLGQGMPSGVYDITANHG